MNNLFNNTPEAGDFIKSVLNKIKELGLDYLDKQTDDEGLIKVDIPTLDMKISFKPPLKRWNIIKKALEEETKGFTLEEREEVYNAWVDSYIKRLTENTKTK